jgi:hypothetical protein
MTRLIVTLLKALLGTALFAALLLGLILFFIETEAGRIWVASALESFLKGRGLQEARIGRITGDFPRAFSLDELLLRWEKGGVSARDITVKWRPLELFSGLLHVEAIDVEQMEILEGEGDRQGESDLDPSIMISALRRLELLQLKAASLRLPRSMDRSGQSYRLEIQSSFKKGGEQQGRLLVEAMGNRGTELRCAIAFAGTDSIPDIRAEARDPQGGPIASLLSMGRAVNILLEGRGPLENWEGSLLLETEGMPAKRTFKASFSLNYDHGKRILGIRRLLAGYNSAELTLSGEISLEDMGYRGSFNLRALNGSPIDEVPFKGILEAEGQFSGRGPSPRFNGVARGREFKYKDFAARYAMMEFTFDLGSWEGSCRGTISDFGSATKNRLWAGSLVWDVERIVFLKQGLSFGPVSLRGDPGTAILSGTYSSPDNTLSLNGRLSMKDAQKIPFPQASLLPFSLEGDFQFDIDIARMEIRAALDGIAERVMGGSIPPFLDGILGDRISLKAEAILEGGERLSIRDAEIKTSSASLTGSALVKDGFIDCRWSISAKKTSDLIPIKIPFLEEGPIDIQGDLSGPYHALSANALLKMKDIQAEVGINSSEGFTKGKIAASGRIGGKALLLRTDLQAAGRTILIKELLFELCGLTAGGEIEFDKTTRTAQGIIKGRTADISPLSDLIPIRASGPVSFDLVLKRSKGGQGIEAYIAGDSLILEGASFEGVRLNAELEEVFSSPRVKGSAFFEKAAFKGLEGRDIELSFLWQEAAGTVVMNRGCAVYSQTMITLMNPLKLILGLDSFQAERTSFEVKLPSEQDKNWALLRLDLTALGEKGTLRLSIHLHSMDKRLFEADLKAPLRFSLWPVVLSLPEQEEISGSLSSDLNLEDLRPVLKMLGNESAGTISCNISIGGTLGSPVVGGTITLADGRFAYPKKGILLTGIKATALLSEGVLEIRHLEASDNAGGRISGFGRLSLFPWGRPDAYLELLLDRFKILNLDEARITASGSISCLRDSDGILLKGGLSAGPAELSIPRRSYRRLEEIPVVEIPAPLTPTPVPEAGKGMIPSNIRFQVGIEVPGRLFLRGRGLESEWEGTLNLTGTLNHPVISGLFRAVRGRFNLLGKRFELKEGEVRLEGTSASSAFISAAAQTRASDITALMRISGTLANPMIELSSDPPIPKDEILARVLFGRSLSRITPLQAITLADAALTLRGGGGLDMMGRARRLLGIDDIEIKVPEKGIGPSLGIGKYLGDRLFIRLESGADPESSKASVQMELTPEILVESEVGADAKGGIGIIWRWDY